jgi:phospholipid/cholesterol/gamma-HCH transport system substrate-binding protein
MNDVTGNFKKVSDDLANSNIKQTLDNANKAVADLQAVMAKVNSKDGSLGLLLNDTKMYDNLNNASKSLNDLVYRFESASKTLRKLLGIWWEEED